MVEPDEKIRAMDAAIFMEAIKSCWSHKGPDMEIGDLIQYLNNQTPEKDRSGRALELTKTADAVWANRLLWQLVQRAQQLPG